MGSRPLWVHIAFRDGVVREWQMPQEHFTTFLDAVTSRETGWALIEGTSPSGKGRTSLAVNRAHVLFVRATDEWEGSPNR